MHSNVHNLSKQNTYIKKKCVVFWKSLKNIGGSERVLTIESVEAVAKRTVYTMQSVSYSVSNVGIIIWVKMLY